MENQPKQLKKCTSKIVNTNDDSASISILNDDCLNHIFSFLPHANRIRLQRVCKHWQKVSKISWTDVSKLDFIKSSWVGDNEPGLNIHYTAVEQVLALCGKNVKHIDFTHRYQSICFRPNPVLATIVNLCSNIQSIDLSCIVCNGEGLHILAKNCNAVTDISLGKCTQDFYENSRHTNKALSYLFSRMKRLRSLRLVETELSINCFQYLPQNCLEIIILESVNFGWPSEYNSNVFASLTALHTLKITCKIEYLDKFFKVISVNPLNFKNLIIHAYLDYNIYFSRITDNDSYVLKLTNLQTLELHGEILTNDCLAKIEKNCKQLERATFKCSTYVDDDSLRTFTRLPKLQYLKLVELCNITNLTLSYAYNLQTLICDSCHKLSAFGFIQIIKSGNIEYLEVKNCMRVSADKLIWLVIKKNRSWTEKPLKLCVEKSKTVRRVINVSPVLQVIEDVIKE